MNESSKRVVLLTGSELRHTFFRRFIGLRKGIDVVRTYCESAERGLAAEMARTVEGGTARRHHMCAREQSEHDFFAVFVNHTPDHSNPVSIPKGDINRVENVEEIVSLAPDLLLAYGCSIIRGPLLQIFRGRFLNLHLGLSPYYRGSGTNFWPLVNREPEYVGATIMHIDEGIDTGEIIHQIRARCQWGDTPSQIGNRLITAAASECCEVILRFDSLGAMPAAPAPANPRYYRKRDYSEESVETLYENFASGMIEGYLAEEAKRHAAAPIITNPAVRPGTTT